MSYQRFSKHHLKRVKAILLLSLPWTLIGCYDPAGDALCNGENMDIRILATTSTGIKIDMLLKGAEETGFVSAGPHYQAIEAFTLQGERIGGFSRDALPEPTDQYLIAAKALMFLITKQGVYPVPAKYHHACREYADEIMKEFSLASHGQNRSR